jgi:hypothetical protein
MFDSELKKYDTISLISIIETFFIMKYSKKDQKSNINLRKEFFFLILYVTP